MLRPLLPALASCAACLACAGASPAPSSASLPSAPSSASAPAPVAPPPAAIASAEPYDDPGEEHDPAKLVPLFEKRNRPTFPKATAGERECWQSVMLTGVARTDFDAVIDHPEVVSLFRQEMDKALENFAKYEQVRAFSLIPDPFTVENGLLTPSLKMRRPRIALAYRDRIEKMYQEQ